MTVVIALLLLVNIYMRYLLFNPLQSVINVLCFMLVCNAHFCDVRIYDVNKPVMRELGEIIWALPLWHLL